MKLSRIKVSEVFLSFQGEGVNVGQPRVFVRLATSCPLSCSFCDSKYARTMSRSLTKDDIQLMKEHPYIVFTGNEPLFSYGPSWILTIVDEIRPEYVEVETNGTIIPSSIYDLCSRIDLWTISPKDPSVQDKEVDTTPHLLDWLNGHYFLDYVVKFVYNNRESDVFILRTVEQYKVPHNNVWIMPRGENRKEYHRHLTSAWSFALTHKFNFSPRIHIDTFDKKRGV